MTDRMDTKGRRVGRRESNGQERMPRRIEAGLCPDLEVEVEALRTEVERLTAALTLVSEALLNPKELTVDDDGVLHATPINTGRAARILDAVFNTNLDLATTDHRNAYEYLRSIQ